MKHIVKFAACSLFAVLLPLSAQAADDVLHVYNWTDYIGEKTLENFTKETGIKVVYDTFDTDEVLETKLLVGKSGYDVVFPGSAFAEHMLKAGVFQKLDPAAIPNIKSIDTKTVELLMPFDAKMEYFIPYTTSITGIAYNEDKIKELIPNADTGSWSLVMDPENAKKLKKCGIGVIDAPTELIQIGLKLAGKPVNTTDKDELQAGADKFKAVRRYISYFNTGKIIADLANGDICAAITWTGDGLIARNRAAEAGKIKIGISMPREGSVFQSDVIGIPKDAPNPKAANIFINYIQRPDVHADIIATIQYGTANKDAAEKLPEAVKTAPGITVSEQQLSIMWPQHNPETTKDLRKITRAWSAVKAGG